MNELKVGIVGCGAIASGVASFAEKELSSRLKITAICDRDIEAARLFQNKLKSHPVICGIDALVQKVDLVIETASIEAAKLVLEKAVSYKKNVIILSVGVLVDNHDLLTQAEKKGISVYVPSGAICGVDGIGALSMSKINKIILTTSKPPAGFIGAEYLKTKKINLKGLKNEKVIFRGNVRQAIKCFPKNINVAATLFSAASIGGRVSKVEVCIKANPRLKRNVHRIEIYAKEAKINIEIENVPSKINPKTSTLAVLSTQYLLKRIFSSFKIGG